MYGARQLVGCRFTVVHRNFLIHALFHALSLGMSA